MTINDVCTASWCVGHTTLRRSISASFRKRKNVVRGAQLGRRRRHTVDKAGLAILRNGVSAGLLERECMISIVMWNERVGLQFSD